MTTDLYEAMRDRIRGFSLLEEEWDGYKAQPPSMITCSTSLLLLSILQDMNLLCPSVWIDSTGDINFKWKLINKTYIEFCVTERKFCYLVTDRFGDPVAAGDNLEVSVRKFPVQLVRLLRRTYEN